MNQGAGKHSQQKEYILSGIRGNMLRPEICQAPVRLESQMPQGMSGGEPAEVPRGYCTQAMHAHNKNLVHMLKYRLPGPS